MFGMEASNLHSLNMYRHSLIKHPDFGFNLVFNLLSGNRPFICELSLSQFISQNWNRFEEEPSAINVYAEWIAIKTIEWASKISSPTLCSLTIYSTYIKHSLPNFNTYPNQTKPTILPFLIDSLISRTFRTAWKHTAWVAVGLWTGTYRSLLFN